MKSRMILLLSALFLFSSCTNFLEPESQDKIIPEEVVQLREYLLGEVISNEGDNMAFVTLMTDDVDYNMTESMRRDMGARYFGYYTWQQDPEIGVGSARLPDVCWAAYYHYIFTCNIILNQLPDMKGTDEERNILKAMTHFMRANSYFTLVNLYGEPYDVNNDGLGIPINEEFGIENKLYTRSSVYEVYDKIEDDLLTSIKYFKEASAQNNISMPSLNAAYLLASRMYLYMKDYENAKKYASLVLETKSGAFEDLRKFERRQTFITENNPEIIFAYSGFKDFILRRSKSIGITVISDDFKDLFERNDLRYNIYCYRDDAKKWNYSYSHCRGKVFRVAEAYLNRAEANAHIGDINSAMDDLNSIRMFRFSKDYELTASSQEEAIEIVKKERRVELCFEYHRWFDLRRYGMPKLIHNYGIDGIEEYVLEKGDAAYTLPIPLSVIKLNTVIKQIQRPNRTK